MGKLYAKMRGFFMQGIGVLGKVTVLLIQHGIASGQLRLRPIRDKVRQPLASRLDWRLGNGLFHGF